MYSIAETQFGYFCYQYSTHIESQQITTRFDRVRYLEYTLDPTKIRKQDATSTIGYIAKNTVGMPLTWNFVRARWKYLFEE